MANYQIGLLGDDGRTAVCWAGSDALIWDAERLCIATDAAGVALWSWNVDTDEIAMDERAHGIWGVPKCRRQVNFKDLSARIHPADFDRVRRVFQETRRVVGAYEIDFRILHGNAIRWVSARGQRGDKGIVARVMFGVFLDVTERKQAEEAREMLAGEMSHRVKNLFAITSSLITLAARSAISTTEMAHDLTVRLAALGRAHDLARPNPGQGAREAALLGDMLAVLLAPYAEGPAIDNRVTVSVPQVHVGEAAARRWPWWCMSWRPTRSSMARSRQPTAQWTCPAPTTAATWWWFGRSGAGRLLPLPRQSRVSGAGLLPRACPASSAAPSHTNGCQRA